MPPPGPYGGPQAPYGPTAQGPGGFPPAGPPPRGGGRPGWLIPVIAVVVVVLIGIGGYAVFGGSSKDDGGSSAASGPLKGKVLWQTQDPPQNGLGPMFVGGWHTTGLTVTVAAQGLVAYDAGTGQKRWQLAAPPLPGGGGPSLICGVSTMTGANVGVIGFGADSSGGAVTKCEGFALVDLATGRFRGQGRLQSGTSIGSDSITAEVVGDTAVIEYGGSLTGFDLSGHQRWRLDTKTAGTDCFVADLLPGANTAMVLFNCLGSDSSVVVAQVSPGNGAVTKKGTVAVPAGIDNATVRLLSAQPVVLDGGTSKDGAFISLDDAFRVKATIPQKGAWGSLDMSSYSGLASHMLMHAAVSADTLVVGTEESAVNELRDTNKIVAFDLATGKQRWATSLGPKVTGVPVAFGDGGVIAMSDGVYETPPQVFKLAAADGKATPMGPAYSRDLIHKPQTSRLYWDGARMYGISLTTVAGTPSVYTLG